LIGTVFAIKKRWSFVSLNIVSLLTAILGFGAYSLGAPSDVPADLRVMTFNVQLFRDYTIEQVAYAIKQENPDVICLQELPKNEQDRQFANLFMGYEFIQNRRLGILSKHPVKEQHNWEIGSHGGYVLGAEINVRNRTLLIINAHLQHFPSDNIREIPTAARNIRDESENLEYLILPYKSAPLILAGDLNSVPTGSVNRMLRRHLTDSFAATSSGFGFTIPSQRPMLRIDYIYATGLVPVRSRVGNAMASDHLPVVADFTLKAGL
jgi:vancomycin resistance protein VanJ